MELLPDDLLTSVLARVDHASCRRAKAVESRWRRLRDRASSARVSMMRFDRLGVDVAATRDRHNEHEEYVASRFCYDVRPFGEDGSVLGERPAPGVGIQHQFANQSRPRCAAPDRPSR